MHIVLEDFLQDALIESIHQQRKAPYQQRVAFCFEFFVLGNLLEYQHTLAFDLGRKFKHQIHRCLERDFWFAHGFAEELGNPGDIADGKGDQQRADRPADNDDGRA